MSEPTEDDQFDLEFAKAMNMAMILCLTTPEHKKIYDYYKGVADRYSLWNEVCWSAGLKETMTSFEFGEALRHGCVEWDI